MIVELDKSLVTEYLNMISSQVKLASEDIGKSVFITGNTHGVYIRYCGINVAFETKVASGDFTEFGRTWVDFNVFGELVRLSDKVVILQSNPFGCSICGIFYPADTLPYTADIYKASFPKAVELQAVNIPILLEDYASISKIKGFTYSPHLIVYKGYSYLRSIVMSVRCRSPFKPGFSGVLSESHLRILFTMGKDSLQYGTFSEGGRTMLLLRNNNSRVYLPIAIDTGSYIGNIFMDSFLIESKYDFPHTELIPILKSLNNFSFYGTDVKLSFKGTSMDVESKSKAGNLFKSSVNIPLHCTQWSGTFLIKVLLNAFLAGDVFKHVIQSNSLYLFTEGTIIALRAR